MHRRPLLLAAALSTAFGTVATPAAAQAVVGQPAPAFSAVDTAGKTVSLADFRGRTVVLEWVNPGCPYVRKHYDSANLPGTQKEATGKGVVWLAVNSTTPDHGDHLSGSQLAKWMKDKNASATATLMDEDGKVGRAYGARTTPHLYIVAPNGTLAYAGAIDSKPTANPADIAGATNHVKVALGEMLAGKPVTTPVTRPYGCSVKYGSAG